MKRRSFIKRSSAVALPMVLGGVNVEALNNPFFNAFDSDDDRVLVLIQLSGGNDGINTVIPKDQYDGMMAVRSNIVIPESQVLDLTDTVGLHPVMGDLKTVFDEGKVNIIQGAGYPNQNRSHFRSTDIWQTGSSAEDVWTTGWIGRYFDTIAPNYPTGYPNEDFPDPLAVTIGSSANETCEGEGGNFSLALADPDNLAALSTPINIDNPDSCYGEKMDFLVTSIVQTNAYNEVIQVANDSGNNMSTKYTETKLADSLKVIARLISGGLKTKVYVVNLGGFDTHGDQVVDGEPTTGQHAELLQELSEAICAFQDDLQLLGIDDRVVGMTYSEFGRRIRSNDALGTDHGTAAPMILFGSCVNPGIMGSNPEISPDATVGEGVPMQYDFRSVYGSVLMDWFGLEQQVVQGLLYEAFQYIPVLLECSPISSTEILTEEEIKFNVFPNPFNESVSVEFTVPTGHVKISLFDVWGAQLKVLTSQRFSAGTHTLQMDGRNLASGSYFYHIQTDFGREVKRVVKVR